MRKTRFVMMVAVCLLITAIYVWAETRKAGLWETTSTMTWQQSPLPGGISPPGSGEPHTTQVCITQQQFEKYGAIVPQVPGCQVTNVVVKAHSMTGDMVCTGRMAGKGTLESSWNDDSHATGSIHFVGSIEVGADNKIVEWTSHSSSIFKSADCGSVKPASPPQ